LQPAAKSLGFGEGSFPVTEKQAKRILTLPINQYLSRSEITQISNSVNDFYYGKR
jgi:dTDP-4-amino-4,6-dideoxygalactose transaminase